MATLKTEARNGSTASVFLCGWDDIKGYVKYCLMIEGERRETRNGVSSSDALTSESDCLKSPSVYLENETG